MYNYREGTEQSRGQELTVPVRGHACPGVALCFGQAQVTGEAVGPGVGDLDTELI